MSDQPYEDQELSPSHEKAKALGIAYKNSSGQLHPERLVKAWIAKREKAQLGHAVELEDLTPREVPGRTNVRAKMPKTVDTVIPEDVTDPILRDNIKRAMVAAKQKLEMVRHQVETGEFTMGTFKAPDQETAERYLDGKANPSMHWKGEANRKAGKPHGEEAPEVYAYYGDVREVNQDIARGCIPVIDQGRQVTGQGGDLLYYRHRVLQQAELASAGAESRERIKDLIEETDATAEVTSASGDSRMANISKQYGAG